MKIDKMHGDDSITTATITAAGIDLLHRLCRMEQIGIHEDMPKEKKVHSSAIHIRRGK
jgi:hypothetical protein